MFRTVSVVGALVVGLCLPSARAQTPFGGDDTCFLPPAANAKCEAGAAKAEGKLIACILKCHADRASGKLADDTAEDACEKTLSTGKSCAQLFAASIAKLTGCPGCINGTTMGNLAGLTETVLDANNGTIYCGVPTTTSTSTTTTSTTTTTTLPTCARLAAIDCTNTTCQFCGQAWCTSQGSTGMASCSAVMALCSGAVGCAPGVDCVAQCLDCDNGLQPCQ